MTDPEADDRGEYIIPARTLRGPRGEMIADIDQAIVGLLALRHLIDDKARPPDHLAGPDRRSARRRSLWSRLLAAILPAAA